MSQAEEIARRVLDRYNMAMKTGPVSPDLHRKILMEELLAEGYVEEVELTLMRADVAKAAIKLRGKKERKAS